MSLPRFRGTNVFALTALLATSMFGCVSVPNIALDKQKSGSFKTISLLKINESQFFTIKNLSTVYAPVGGAIAGAVVAVIEQNRSNEFVAKYNASAAKFNDIMADELQKDLANNGLKATYLADQAPKAVDDKDDYSHISTNDDVILNIWFTATGYIAPGLVDSDFEPVLGVTARLLDTKTKEVIYQKTYYGGYNGYGEYVVFVPCGMNQRYGSFETLMNNFESAKQGLIECHKLIAQKIAADLK